MSEILDLAKTFEAKSKQQAATTEKALQSVFERHERFISEALRSSEQKLSADIHDRNRKLKRLALKGWAWMVLSFLLVGIASGGALWWSGERIAKNLTEIEQQQAMLSHLKRQTWGLRLQEGPTGRFILLPRGTAAETGWTSGSSPAIKLTQE